jgi:NTP pyrophosphatase (non-canonical NTP hydrolase)
MEFNEYQMAAERTARSEVEERGRFTNFAFGLTGETGEVIDCLKKHLFHGHPLDREKLKIELGDVMWYVATLATTASLSLEEIAVANIEKLRSRYPEGFSKENSINRESRKEEKLSTYKHTRYLERILNRFNQQREKGISKYGQILEENPRGVILALEALAEELTDALMYTEEAIEKCKGGLKDEDNRTVYRNTSF